MSTFYGIGVGPGDPELLTLKAFNTIQSVDVLAYLVNDKGDSQAKAIAQAAIDQKVSPFKTLPIYMPMSTDRTLANKAYDEAAAAIEAFFGEGLSVGFLCEGDPLFFGSCIYLLDRLPPSTQKVIVPGISSVHAAASALQVPLTQQEESLAVVSGRLSDEKLLTILSTHDSVVILKAGLRRVALMDLIEQAGRAEDAHYIEYISREQERSCSFKTLPKEKGPYFSLFMITNRGA